MKIIPPPFFTNDALGMFVKLVNEKPKAAAEASKPTDSQGRYLHWDKLRHLTPPDSLTHEEWWAAIKLSRLQMKKNVPFIDKEETLFSFTTPDKVLQDLHWLDRHAAGQLSGAEPVASPHTRDYYLISSLIDEAINSSQLEGARTSWAKAKEMLHEGRNPADRDEWMIFNNYQAMNFIREYHSEKLTPEIIIELHKMLTKNTFDDPADSGRYRRDGDDVRVVDGAQGETLHVPPKPAELPDRVKRICDFANQETHTEFIHPVIKAIMLHFMLAYDHPFVDGNGRTARTLFYWYMAKQGYWLIEFLSISQVIKEAPAQYGKAFLCVETDESDVTYFVLHQLDVLRKAIGNLQAYLKEKTIELQEAEDLISVSPRLRGRLNHRQLTLLRHALRHPNAIYTIQGHKNSHGTVYQTARSDLLTMSDDLKLLKKEKVGKEWTFYVPPNLRQRLQAAK